MKRPFRVTKRERGSQLPVRKAVTPLRLVTFIARFDLFEPTDGRSVKNTYRRSHRMRTMKSLGPNFSRAELEFGQELARRQRA
jgi:hypothetical protein